MSEDDYSYETSGLDGFLTRSIDDAPQARLADQGARSTQQRYEDTQTSGFVGEAFQVGPVRIGNKGIEMVDDSGNVVLLIGEE